ncbi:MAG: hypothetical protein ABIP13_10585 [Tepidiformaceae bacterium]
MTLDFRDATFRPRRGLGEGQLSALARAGRRARARYCAQDFSRELVRLRDRRLFSGFGTRRSF